MPGPARERMLNPVRWSRRLVASSTLVLMAAGGLAVLVPAGAAHADASFDGFASADGIEQILSNPSIPAGLDITGGGPQTQSHLTSFGVADASAQTPYTGGTVPGLPGTAGALMGLPFPAWPFIVSTNNGEKPRDVSYPGMTLHAESGDTDTRASATVGSDASGAVARSQVTLGTDGTVTASSSVVGSAVKLGPYAELSGVRTFATVVADGFSGKLTRTATTAVGRLSFPGLVLTIPSQTPDTVPTIPGAPVPPVTVPSLPVPRGGTTLHDPDLGLQDGYFTVTLPHNGEKKKYAVPAGPVLAALKAQGVTVTFEAAQKTTTGIISGSYSFAYTVPAPPANTYYNGPTKVTQSIGGAVASVTFRAVKPDGAGFPATGPIGGTSGGVTGPSLPATSGTSGLTAPASASGLPPAVADQGPATSSPGFTVAGFRIGTGIGNLYLCLVAVALVGYVSATVLRLSGVRFLWSS